MPARSQKTKTVDQLFEEHRSTILLDYLSAKIQFDYPGQLGMVVAGGQLQGIQWLQGFFKAETSVKIRVANLSFTVAYSLTGVIISLSESLSFSLTWNDVGYG